MALEIVKEEKPKGFVLDRYLYLNATKDKVLEEGDTAAAFVLGGPGSTIPRAEAERLGLLKAEAESPAPASEPTPEPEPAPVPEPTPVEEPKPEETPAPVEPQPEETEQAQAAAPEAEPKPARGARRR